MKHLIPALAIGLSACAVITSLWLGWTALEHNRLSVRPLVLGVPYLEGPDERNGLYLKNVGLGPAIIKSASISLDGKRYDLTGDIWQDALISIDVEPLCFRTARLPLETTIQVGQELPLLSMRSSSSVALCLHESIKLLSEHQIHIALEYQSLYGENLWVGNSYRLPSARHDYARALRKLNTMR